MPGFPFPGRPGGEHDEPLLDMIIARRALPPDAPSAMHDLARMLAAVAGPAEPAELTREAAVRAAFRRTVSPVGVSPAARRPVRHRRARRSRERLRSRVRLATVMVVAAAGLGSVLAAYIDVLPSPIQQLAHVAVAAPAPHDSGSSQSATLGIGRRAPRKVQPSSPAPRPATRRAPLRSPARRSPRRRITIRGAGRLITALPNTPAPPVRGTRRLPRRRDHPVLARRRSGIRRGRARPSPPGRPTSPRRDRGLWRATRIVPDVWVPNL